MNTKFILLTPLILIFFSSCKKVEEVGGCQLTKSLDKYQMIWNDEFIDAQIDLNKWTYDLGDGCHISEDLCGWGNNELEYYTSRLENAFIENGNLIIKAIRESPAFMDEHLYTSARMLTRGKADWRYGRIDIRAKLPIGQGIWPAIWMLPTDTLYGGWPRSGEIDIMEYLGHQPQKVLGTIHYGNDTWRFDSQEYVLEDGTRFSDDFHVFSLLWNESCIQFLVDENEIGDAHSSSSVLPSTYPFDQNFHLILNLAVGGNLPGNPDATTFFPQTMEIDYVRIYEEK